MTLEYFKLNKFKKLAKKGMSNKKPEWNKFLDVWNLDQFSTEIKTMITNPERKLLWLSPQYPVKR